MRKFFTGLLFSIISVSALAVEANFAKKVVTYPVPNSEKVFTSYSVSVNGKTLDLYKALSPKFEGGEYYFCYFDFEGEVEVKVHSKRPFTAPTRYTWSPEQRAVADKIMVGEVYPYSLKAKISKNDISFKADKPFQAIVIRNERARPLLIFGNPIEKNVPQKGTPNVIYLSAGVHYKSVVLKDNQTLYLAGGAVLKAPVTVRGCKNVKICGRGIISADNRERGMSHTLFVYNSENLQVSDIIIKDPVGWTFNMMDVKNVLIDNLKICAGRMINDDAIDICNSSNIKIINTFARAEDDIIAIKGIYASGKRVGNKLVEDVNDRNNNAPCENIEIENCIFWTDSANIFRIGYECEAPYFKNLRAKNLYIPFYSDYRAPKPNYNWSHSVIWLQATNQMPISDMFFENIHIRSNGEDYPLLTAIPQTVRYPAFAPCKIEGSVSNCSVRDVVVEGKKGKFNGEVYIVGKSPDCSVKNITLSNFVYFGKKQTSETIKNYIGDFSENIKLLKN